MDKLSVNFISGSKEDGVCNPMDCNRSGSSVHGILQARTLEWVAIPFSRRSSWSKDQTRISYISCIDRWVLYHWHHLGRLGENIYKPKMHCVCWDWGPVGEMTWRALPEQTLRYSTDVRESGYQMCPVNFQKHSVLFPNKYSYRLANDFSMDGRSNVKTIHLSLTEWYLSLGYLPWK